LKEKQPPRAERIHEIQSTGPVLLALRSFSEGGSAVEGYEIGAVELSSFKALTINNFSRNLVQNPYNCKAYQLRKGIGCKRVVRRQF